MKKKAKKPTFNVIVTAHDSWSGPESYTLKFATKRGAQNYCKRVNEKNTATTVPEYYETARIQD